LEVQNWDDLVVFAAKEFDEPSLEFSEVGDNVGFLGSNLLKD